MKHFQILPNNVLKHCPQGGGNAGKSAASNINLRAMLAIAQQCNRIEGALELQ